MAEPIIGRDRCRRALDGLWRVSESSDIGTLIALLNLPSR
jgi:hypothetical protein